MCAEVATRRQRLFRPLCFAIAVLLLAPVIRADEAVMESAREIPVAERVDIVVVGGTIAGVAAALEAAEQGHSVFVIAPRPYLGEDLCDSLQLWLEEDEKPTSALVEKIFAKGSPAAPVRVKRTLESELLRSGVRFLLSCYATDVLVDKDGHPAGVVIANRAGRQAVIAKVIIDATTDASVARRAGARFHPWPEGEAEFRRVILGGKVTDESVIRRRVPLPGAGHTYGEYSYRAKLKDGDFLSLSRIEQQARDEIYRAGQLRSSGRLRLVIPNAIVGRRTADNWEGFEDLDLGYFQPRDVERVFVAGCGADLPRSEVERLMRPTVSEAVGRFIGSAVASKVGGIERPSGVRLTGRQARTAVRGDVLEPLSGLRPTDDDRMKIFSEARALPVLGAYDVVVAGGGTSGAPAAIGAARRGAKVLVVEYQHGLGGTGTLGLIGKPYHGKNVGFAREVPFPGENCTIEDKMEWYRWEIRRAGGEIWFGVLAAGALVDGDRVRGAVVVTPRQRGVVLADVVIDATGNADVAIAAGAEYLYGADGDDLAMQGAGIASWPLERSYVNTDYVFVDESDMVDVWRALAGSRQAMEDPVFDAAPLVQTRERRRVVGDHILSYLDQIAGRTYPDSIVFSASDYDSHGYPSLGFFALIPHDEESRKANHPAPGGSAYTPYRCLLPRGLKGILVTGLGISMHRDASAMIRMQRDLANQGYAAGVAAAMAASGDLMPRDIDIRALQKHLVEIGNLPAEALDHTDSFPLPEAQVREAVRRLPLATNPQEAGVPLAVILSHREKALPLLRSAYEASSGEQRLTYARVLGFLGERDVIPTLSAALDEVEQWDAKILQGRMADYAHLPTPVDSLILALGYTRDARALPPILRKLETLDAGVTLSHHRSVALALEAIGSPEAAEPLARLLEKPGMSGYAMTKLAPLDQESAQSRRTNPLREITIARALYRCGDHNGIGERILRGYKSDLRGLFARHAAAVLEASDGSRSTQ